MVEKVGSIKPVSTAFWEKMTIKKMWAHLPSYTHAYLGRRLTPSISRLLHCLKTLREVCGTKDTSLSELACPSYPNIRCSRISWYEGPFKGRPGFW